MIIFVQQAMQDIHGLTAVLGFFQLAAGCNQVLVTVGYIASACITHHQLQNSSSIKA
jgi:hypothetical protein